MSGFITRADGEHFDLDIDGEEHTFALGLDATVDVDLLKCIGSGTKVTVHYEDIPDDSTHVAYAVFVPRVASTGRA
ncbi:MAG: hypothetical protein ACM3X5_05695 [Bacillota bacterium]